MKINLIKFHRKRLTQFDEITRIRLILLAWVSILTALIIPVISSLYYLLSIHFDNYIIESATILSIIAFIENFGLKLVKKVMNTFSFSNIFLILIFFDIIWGFIGLLWFYDKTLFVWFDSILVMVHAVFVMAFGYSLNNYITYFHNEKYTLFQEYRNDLMAEASIIGTALSVILNGISTKIDILFFSGGIFILAFYQFKYLKIFKKYDFRYMYRYMKSRKK